MKKLLILSNLLLILLASIMHLFFMLDIDLITADHRKRILKNVVEIPISLISNFEEQARNNKDINRAQIQEDVVTLINSLKYNQNNIFLILDGEGNMISHPLRPELTWWNMLYETDSNGNPFFRSLIANAKRDDDVYMEVNWHSKYSQEIYEDQIIYGRYFWPWDWLICSISYDSEFLQFNRIKMSYGVYALIGLFIINNVLVLYLTRNKWFKRN